MLQEFIAKEKEYFRKLHTDAQKLLATIFLYNLIGTIAGIFLNAFLWRQTHDIFLVALYNCIAYAVIPFGFYLNGYLLRKYPPAIPYTLSLLLSGLAITVLMFLPAISYPIIVLYSIADGLSLGIYWANRNLLTLKTTNTHDRIYFSSIETASSTIMGVIIPAAIGWFITFGTPLHLYSILQGYQFLVLYMLIVILRIGFISKSIHTAEITIPTLVVKNVNSNWKKFRAIQFIYGLENAVDYFVPVLIVLILVGNEAALGTVQSISAIIAGLLIYFLGKSLHTRHRLLLISISIVTTIIGGAIFGFLYSALGIVIFIAAQAIAGQCMWVGGSSVNYDLIDEDNKDTTQHYAYVCDEEIYLNGGRVVGICLFMLLMLCTSKIFALRFAPVIFASTQILLLFAYRSIENKLQNKNRVSLTSS